MVRVRIREDAISASVNKGLSAAPPKNEYRIQPETFEAKKFAKINSVKMIFGRIRESLLPRKFPAIR